METEDNQDIQDDQTSTVDQPTVSSVLPNEPYIPIASNTKIPSVSNISESEILMNQKIMLENQQKILLNQEKILSISDNKKGKPSDKETQDQEEPKNLRFIRQEKSMEEIKSNSLVSG